MNILPGPIAKSFWFLICRVEYLSFGVAGAFFQGDTAIVLQVFLNKSFQDSNSYLLHSIVSFSVVFCLILFIRILHSFNSIFIDLFF